MNNRKKVELGYLAVVVLFILTVSIFAGAPVGGIVGSLVVTMLWLV